MKKATAVALMVLFFALTAFAEDIGKDFTFTTVDGGTIASRSLRGAPLVVNVGAHW